MPATRSRSASGTSSSVAGRPSDPRPLRQPDAGVDLVERRVRRCGPHGSRLHHCVGIVRTGSGFLPAGLHEGEDEHQEAEQALRSHVAVVDPEPVASIGHREKGVSWAFGRAPDADQGPEGAARSHLGFRRRRHAPVGHVRLWHLDDGREVDQDLQDGPAEDRDLRVVGRHRAVDDLKLPAGGIEAQQLPDGQDVSLDARVHLLPQGHQHGLFAIDPAHPETDRARELEPTEPLQEDVELRVRGPCPKVASEAVVEAIHDVHREPKDDVRGIPRLNHAQEGRRGDRRHQGAREALARERGVGDGRPVGILTLSAQRHAAVGHPWHYPAGAEDAPQRRERALHRVPADDLPDVQEHRGVAVPQLDEVQEHLALPRLGDRPRVVESVARHRRRADARASGHAERSE